MLLRKTSKTNIKTFIFCFVFETIAEAIAIFFDAWKYTNPTILGVPLWLPILWGIAGIFIIRVYSFFKNK